MVPNEGEFSSDSYQESEADYDTHDVTETTDSMDLSSESNESSNESSNEPLESFSDLPPAVSSNEDVALPPIDKLLERVLKKLRERRPIRLKLQGGGRLLLDKQVPFLCVYIEPAHGISALRRWVTGEVASFVLPADAALQEYYRPLLETVVSFLSQRFGSFLLLELRLAETPSQQQENPVENYHIIAEQVRESLQPLLEAPNPTLRLVGSSGMLEAPIFETLIKEMSTLHFKKKLVDLEEVPLQEYSVMGIPGARLLDMCCTAASLELEHPYILGAYEIAAWKELRPFFRSLMRRIKRTFFHFSRKYTPFDPPHYLALGRKALVKVVRRVDKTLATINRKFEFLLYVTPVNTEAAWSEFRRVKYQKEPQFLYRPLGFEPHLLKRELYNIPVERIDDPTLAHLFLEKQEQLDRQITMLWDRNTPRFLFEGLQLYGAVPDELLEQAKALLALISPRSRGESTKDLVKPEDFAQRARDEIAAYQEVWEEFPAQVFVRSDVAGILVSQGNLLIGTDAVIPSSRVEPLVHHEVGTHCLTTANGHIQTLSLLGNGLAGYEGLQEGLAVLAEYLCGGLSKPRLRLLAGRVVAAHSVIHGATFLDTYQLLRTSYSFNTQTAFTIAMRVHRGGGFVKDMVYLQGLLQLFKTLQKGQELIPLYVGKIGIAHISLVQELLWRKVLHAPKILPFFLQTEQAQERLQSIRDGLTLQELVRTL